MYSLIHLTKALHRNFTTLRFVKSDELGVIFFENHLTPEKIDSEILSLVKLVGTKTKPFFINTTPESYAKINGCFPAVAEKIARDGGGKQFGWQIWKSKFLVEAEFHVVWLSSEGLFFDITPKSIKCNHILFLPDSTTTYEGCQVDNIRLNITKNRLVDDYIALSKAIFRFQNDGVRAFQHEFTLSRSDANYLISLENTRKKIEQMIDKELTRNSTCFCLSGVKYKHCHGKNILDV